MGNKQVIPNTHNIHIIKPKQKKPRCKTCRNCQSRSILYDKSVQPHKKFQWCQYYGKQINPTDQGCKKWS